MTDLNDPKELLLVAIKGLSDAFVEPDDVHDVEVRLDLLRSRLEDFLEFTRHATHGCPFEAVGENVSDYVRTLEDYAQSHSYGLSTLEGEDIDNANATLNSLEEELTEWLKRQE